VAASSSPLGPAALPFCPEECRRGISHLDERCGRLTITLFDMAQILLLFRPCVKGSGKPGVSRCRPQSAKGVVRASRGL
jgi:hypothetical protein